jgi:RNA polymerase sigma-54 factor
MARFDVRPAQVQRAEQRMLLQPRMLQSIEVLALPIQDLAQFLAEKALENEALSLTDPRDADEARADSGDDRARRRDERPPRGTREATDRHDEMLQAAPDREKGVPERALEQIALFDLDPDLERWTRFLVGCLDDNGWLSASDAELLALAHAAGLEPSEDHLQRAIACVQRLEPRGLGGRNALEALLLQLDPHDEDYAHLCRLLEDFLEDLARNKRPAVARALSIETVELERLIERLGGLDPRPGRSLCSQQSETIRPDVVVERTETGFDVRVERSGLPAVAVDPAVVEQALDRTQPRDVRAWLRGKVEEARWLTEAVEGRRITLLRVARVACHHQSAFLEHGAGNLAPLSMSTVADELGLALSTVSRAVQDKSVQTPHGIVPLRSFFQSAAGGSATAAVDDVRAAIRALFAAEDPAAPLSDDAAVERLVEVGIKLSRRSVAKHRAELGVPSSYLRRRHS